MVVEFSKEFIKKLKRHTSKEEAKKLVKSLSLTTPSEGDFVALVTNIVIREKRLKTFRFYFIVDSKRKHILTKEELDEFLLKFVALSKKNNQQEVINKLKSDLKLFGYDFNNRE
ncbi:MAG: hypothetical protein ACMXYE_02485 [Candidatus Woesearchaeota archaeon]